MIKYIVTKQDGKLINIDLTTHDHMYFSSSINNNGYVETYAYVNMSNNTFWYTWIKSDLPLIEHIWVDSKTFWENK